MILLAIPEAAEPAGKPRASGDDPTLCEALTRALA